jgi:antibiotic biosynthesis monooxygenase (ABM) superfamily enzyme
VDETVTTTVVHEVAPGREADFHAWASAMLRQAESFPGFRGGGILGPAETGDEWHVVYRWVDQDAARRWEGSSVRARWLSRAASFAQPVEVQRTTGLRAWFEMRGRSPQPPPKWKMALVTLAAVFPPVLAFNVTLIPFLSNVSVVLRTFALCVSVTVVVTWVMMPRLQRLLKGWLQPPGAGAAPAGPGSVGPGAAGPRRTGDRRGAAPADRRGDIISDRRGDPATDWRDDPLTGRRGDALADRRGDPMAGRRAGPTADRGDAVAEDRWDPLADRRGDAVAEGRWDPLADRRGDAMVDRRGDVSAYRRGDSTGSWRGDRRRPEPERGDAPAARRGDGREGRRSRIRERDSEPWWLGGEETEEERAPRWREPEREPEEADGRQRRRSSLREVG